MSDCPLPTALTTAPYDLDNCVNTGGKIGRFVFQRRDDTNNTFINGTNGIEESTSWDLVPDAAGNTKVVVTPMVEEVSFGESGIIENSENIDGAPFRPTTGPTPVTFKMRNLSASMFSALNDLQNEPSLVVYFIYADNKIGAKLLSSSPDTHVGFPISYRTTQIQDPSKEGAKGDEFMYTMDFILPQGWGAVKSVTTAESGFFPSAMLIR